MNQMVFAELSNFRYLSPPQQLARNLEGSRAFSEPKKIWYTNLIPFELHVLERLVVLHWFTITLNTQLQHDWGSDIKETLSASYKAIEQDVEFGYKVDMDLNRCSMNYLVFAELSYLFYD